MTWINTPEQQEVVDRIKADPKYATVREGQQRAQKTKQLQREAKLRWKNLKTERP